VILPSFTFFATGHAVLWSGLRPVFADCDPAAWTIDPVDVERKITDRTAAIIAVHLYGNPCAVEQLEDIAARHKLKLIFDSAHAFGSLRGNRPVGQFGDAEVFSLSPTKLLVAGEGGLISTNDCALARMLRAARNYGDSGSYDPEMLGLSARMTEFNAALGLAGLDILGTKIARHNCIAARYAELLASLPGLRFQHVEPGDVSTYKDYSIQIERAAAQSRDELAAALLEDNIETRKYFYPPLHRQKLYEQYYSHEVQGLPHTEAISSGILSLPIYHSLPDETVDGVALAIRRLLSQPGPLQGGSRCTSS
jgi:dTDP-4-amino-4,6-dideoxygalactose transaminase